MPELSGREAHHPIGEKLAELSLRQPRDAGQNIFTVSAQKRREPSHRITLSIAPKRETGLPLLADVGAVDIIKKLARLEVGISGHFIGALHRSRRHARLLQGGGGRAGRLSAGPG